MSSKFKDAISLVKEKRSVREGAETELDSLDMKALSLAAFQIFMPALLGMLAVFAAVIFLLVQFWK